MTTRKATTPEPSVFDLSARGQLPSLLRMLANQIEANLIHTDNFSWAMSMERFEFTARFNLNPQDK